MKVNNKLDLVVGEEGKFFSKELNSIVDELENVITSSGQTLDENKTDQLKEAISSIGKDSSITPIQQNANGNIITIDRDILLDGNTIIWFIPLIENTGALSISYKGEVKPAVDFGDASSNMLAGMLLPKILYYAVLIDGKWHVTSVSKKPPCSVVSKNRDPLISDNECSINAIWTNTDTGKVFKLESLTPVIWKLITVTIKPDCSIQNAESGFSIGDKLNVGTLSYVMYKDCGWALEIPNSPDRDHDTDFANPNFVVGDVVKTLDTNFVYTVKDVTDHNAVWNTPSAKNTILNVAIPGDNRTDGFKNDDEWIMDGGDKYIFKDGKWLYTYTSNIPNNTYDTTLGYPIGHTITNPDNSIRECIANTIDNAIWALQKDRDPIATDDISKGFLIGTFWVNTTTKTTYIIKDTTLGAAIWENIANTPIPIINPTSLSIVEEETKEIIITNHSNTIKYSIVSSDENIAFGAVNGNTISVVTYPMTSSGSATLTLIATDVNRSASNPITIDVTVLNVGTTTDDAIVNTDYAANVAQNDGFNF